MLIQKIYNIYHFYFIYRYYVYWLTFKSNQSKLSQLQLSTQFFLAGAAPPEAPNPAMVLKVS